MPQAVAQLAPPRSFVLRYRSLRKPSQFAYPLEYGSHNLIDKCS